MEVFSNSASDNRAQGGRLFKLNSSNYYIWKCSMRALLCCENLYDPIEWGGVKPSHLSEKDWEIMNSKTVWLIMQWIDDSLFHLVELNTNAPSLWMKLANLYEPKCAPNKLNLLTRLVNMKYREGDSVIEYLGSFQGVLTQLEDVNLTLDDEVQALMLLNSLPNSWENVVVPLCISAPDGKVTLSRVEQDMLNEEIRRKDRFFCTHFEASVVEQPGRSKNRNNQNTLDNSRGRPKVKKDIRCFHCGKIWHIKRQCTMLKI